MLTPRALSIEHYPVDSMTLKEIKSSEINVKTGRPTQRHTSSYRSARTSRGLRVSGTQSIKIHNPVLIAVYHTFDALRFRLGMAKAIPLLETMRQCANSKPRANFARS